MGAQVYLIVTPAANSLYRGCVVYRVSDLGAAQVERLNGVPRVVRLLGPRGDFNGACGYAEGLGASGIIMSQAFFTGDPIFRLFSTGIHL